jgi:hypothetical protein
VTTENDNVSGDEYILRRIPNLPGWVDTNQSRPVSTNAFRATGNDTLGISVFRERFTTPQEVATFNVKPDGYFVVRILASELFGLGLTLKPDPLPPGKGPRGHALIPGLYFGMPKNEERSLRAKIVLLVNSNWQKNVAYTP